MCQSLFGLCSLPPTPPAAGRPSVAVLCLCCFVCLLEEGLTHGYLDWIHHWWVVYSSYKRIHYDTAMWECFNFLFKVFVVFEHVLIREGAYPPALLLTTAALGAVVMQRYDMQ